MINSSDQKNMSQMFDKVHNFPMTTLFWEEYPYYSYFGKAFCFHPISSNNSKNILSLVSLASEISKLRKCQSFLGNLIKHLPRLNDNFTRFLQAHIYLPKINNRNTRKRLTMFNVNDKNHDDVDEVVLVFLLLTFNTFYTFF